MSTIEKIKDLGAITLLKDQELIEIKGGGDPPPFPDDDLFDEE